MVNKSKKRTYIGTKFQEVAELPNLISIQLNSFDKFLQKDKAPNERDKNFGLEGVFRTIFPIESPETGFILGYQGYEFDFSPDNIHLDEKACKERGLTYSVPIKATLTLDNANDHTRQEKKVFFGDIPLMTARGSFIINGTERVVVSQIHRSPGVIAQYEKGVYSSRIIPSRGSWLEFEIDDRHEGLYAKIDRKKRILVTIFLRSLGFLETREDIIKAFYASKTLQLAQDDKQRLEINNYYVYKNYFDNAGNKIIRAGDGFNPAIVESLLQNGINEVEVVDFEAENALAYDTILKCFEQEEKYISREDGEDEPSLPTVLHEVFQGVLRSEMMESSKAREELRNMFFNERYYNLGEVGKYKFNAKFYPGENNPQALSGTTLRMQDMVETIKYLINVFHGKEQIDDIDHLGNRRVRCVGELIENQLKSAFFKLEKTVKEKMTLQDKDKVKIQNLISIKPITTAIKDFYAGSQLSQFMDQVNPLSELTHKRRITALGPGGLNRERASFEVRDVHYTHYGRMCPIETPEGQNIGLVVTLANYTKITEYGFLETPYRKVVNGKATKEIKYMDAVEEEHYYIAQSTSEIDDKGNFVEDEVPVRKKGDYSKQKPEDIAYMDVSPRQMISIAASLIPFLEHDDANRALMGSNMQRQAVPLLFPEAPRVGTGMESRAAYDSGVLVKAKRDGKVTYVSSSLIEVTPEDAKDKKDKDVYVLDKMIRTNQETCFNQHPVVSNGDKVVAGQVLADGPATDNGELALGRNILVGFVPWNGYNYEDAVLISERVVKEDLYTSVHISEFSVDVRETKLGLETVTREIPNASSEAIANLDADGLIKIGTRVKVGDILVGKVTPKGDGELTPEKKLLNAIFGKKADDVRDSSLRIPHGTEGTVIGICRLKKDNGNELLPGVEETIKVQIANKRKLRPGDKMAGRHGNKGVVSRILPVEDMPYMADGTPLDVCLNPLGVPSRMNIGQLMETQLGWAAVKLDEWYNSPVFQSASMEQIEKKMEEAGLPKTSKQALYDGRTGEKFVNDVFCGYIYYLKLNHLVEDKMHARSIGPYSLVIQQPLGGRAQFGGQRFGEMEVWALEAYGAANTLQEILTIKSDDMTGRVVAYESLVKGNPIPPFGTPEAFNVLLQEVRGLGFDMQIYDTNGKRIAATQRDQELLDKKAKK